MLRELPGGGFVDVAPQVVEEAEASARGHFDVMPDDVYDELATVRAESQPRGFTHRLVVRRLREVQNTMYHRLPSIRRRMPYNSAYLHPLDIDQLALSAGQEVRIESAHGSIVTRLEADDTMRRGVVSIAHGWGGLPEDPPDFRAAGACSNLLISTDSALDPINAMPRMTAIPVRITATLAAGAA